MQFDQMLSFIDKKTGAERISVGGKTLFEAAL
jgi:hypothetical protein